MWSTIKRWLNQIGMTPKRCICKRSSLHPLCDGSHADQPWCAPKPLEHITRLVIASPSLSSLAEWWAAKINGQTITNLTHPIQGSVEELWVLSDGVQLPLLKLLLEQIPHRIERWIHTDEAPLVPLDWLNRHEQYHHLLPTDFELQTLNPNDMPSIRPISIEFQRIFVSHAVSDESMLLPVLEHMESLYNIEFFICSTIPSQANWYSEIEQHLRKSDIVWAFLSMDFSHSTFCAFEIGMARALDKKIQLFSIDGSTPPTYIQHQQMHSLQRVQSYLPWFSQVEVLVHICTKTLNETRTS